MTRRIIYDLTHTRQSGLFGPLAGGLLYNRFGFRGPILFGIIITVVDLVGRLLIIERKAAIRYAPDPAATADALGVNQGSQKLELGDAKAQSSALAHGTGAMKDQHGGNVPSKAAVMRTQSAPGPRLSLLAVVVRLGKSPRTLAAICCTLIYG